MKLLTALVLLSVVAWATADEFKYIQNNQIRVGVDTSKGGTIGYLSAGKDGPTSLFLATHSHSRSFDCTVENGGNVINDHDQGRLVQLSFYSGPSGYDGCSWSGHPWSWNPIGGGDAYGHNTQILELDAEGDSLSVASRPLQWCVLGCCASVCIWRGCWSVVLLHAHTLKGHVTTFHAIARLRRTLHLMRTLCGTYGARWGTDGVGRVGNVVVVCV